MDFWFFIQLLFAVVAGALGWLLEVDVALMARRRSRHRADFTKCTKSPRIPGIFKIRKATVIDLELVGLCLVNNSEKCNAPWAGLAA
jgi:hypothetical protein